VNDRQMSVADYGSCAGVEVRSTAAIDDAGGECERLIKHEAGETKAVSGRAVATVVIFTALNILSSMDRLAIVGLSMQTHFNDTRM